MRALCTLASLTLLLAATGLQAAPPGRAPNTNSMQVANEGFRYSPQRPTTTPYLALAPSNVGSFSMLNYYTIVRPQVQQQAINRFQGQNIRDLQQTVAGGADPRYAQTTGVRPTGNYAWYMNHDRYFSSPPSPGAGNRSVAGTSGVVVPPAGAAPGESGGFAP